MLSCSKKPGISRVALSAIGAFAAAVCMVSTTALASPIIAAGLPVEVAKVKVCVVDSSGGSFDIVTTTTGPAGNLVTGGTVNIAAGTCATVANDANTTATNNFTTTIQLGARTLDHSDCQDTFNQFNLCPGTTTSATVTVYANAFHGFTVQYTLVPLPPPPLPSVNKAFSPNVIADGGTTVLTFTVTNPATGPARSNVGFVDTLPTGLKLANATVGGTCAGAAAATTVVSGGTTITVANLQVAAGVSSCTVTVNVTNVTGQFNASCTGNPTAFTNFASSVTVSNVINAITPSCVVVNPPAPTGCTVTRGFILNQLDLLTNGIGKDIILAQIIVTNGGTALTKEQIRTALSTPGGGLIQLKAQLITALANISLGAATNPAVAAAIVSAKNLLTTNSTDKAAIGAAITTLDTFNNGLAAAPASDHCNDAEEAVLKDKGLL